MDEETKQEREIDGAIIAQLEELGGGKPSEDALEFAGNRLIVPETMSAKGAIRYLRDYIEREEQPTIFDRTFRYRPLDVGLAVQRAVKKLSGMPGLQRAIQTMFGPIPPEMRTVSTGPTGQTAQVPVGEIELPIFDGKMLVEETTDRELGELGQVRVMAPRKHRAAVEGLFKLIEDELRERSIYRGHAIYAGEEPEFWSLTGLDAEEIIFSEATARQLDANIWSLLRHTDRMREHGLPLKRSVCLFGGYGTGKTSAAHITAQIATANGWTFLYVRPDKDDLAAAMATARLYSPAVVFFEDVDTLDTEQASGASKLLDMFDGIGAKGSEVVAILTTNHPERIHKGMLRAGRLDAVIELGNLDRPGVERLVRKLAGDKLDAETDFDAVFAAMSEFAPAFVREAVDRASRYAIARSGDVDTLTTSDFVEAAEGMADHLALMDDASDTHETPKVDRALREAIREAIDGSPVEDEAGYAALTVRRNGH